MTKKNNGKDSGKDLVPQLHGGALKKGGMPGNKGNPQSSGIVPSAIRQHCRGSFAERVSILEDIADGNPMPMTKVVGDEVIELEISATIKDRTQAIDLLGKYGGVDKLSLTVDEQPEEAMTPERITSLFEQIQRIRTVKQLEKLLVGAVKKQIGE